MWITTLISENFKDIIDILAKKPTALIILAFMFLSGVFIHKWSDSKDNSVTDLKARDTEIKGITDSMYNYKYQAIYYKELYEKHTKQTDSLLKESNQALRIMMEKQNNK